MRQGNTQREPTLRGRALARKKELSRESEATNKKTATIGTAGEVFTDGTVIELIRDRDSTEQLKLLVWNGADVRVGNRVEYNDHVYVPPALDPTIVRALRLPSQSAPYGTTRGLFNELRKQFRQYTALSENFVSLVCSFAICTWFADCLQAAPCLLLVGPSVNEAGKVLQLLDRVCRHSLLLGELTAAGFCSLPMRLCPTVLINQQALGVPILRLLRTSNARNLYVVRNGHALNLFCSKAILSMGPLEDTLFNGSAIRIPVTPSRRPLPILDERVLQGIANDLQPKLLAYRLANLAKVQNSEFDAPQFNSPMRELARTLGASIADDQDLQAGVISLLQDRNEEVLAERWTDLYAVVIEGVLFFCHDEGRHSVYVGEVAVAANTIMRGRGEKVELEARAIGEKLRYLGLPTCPRDSRGYKLVLTESVRRRTHELAHDFDVPSVGDGTVRCVHCIPLMSTDGTQDWARVKSDYEG